MAKYIFNGTGSKTLINVCDRTEIEDDTGRKIRLNKPKFTIEFEREIVDKFTGQLLSDGWTKVDDSQYEELCKDEKCGFNGLVASGQFEVSDEIPITSTQAAVQKYAEDVVKLRQENKELEEKNKALEKDVADLKALLAKKKPVKKEA